MHVQSLSDQVSDNRHRQRQTPADIHGQRAPGQACCGAGSRRLYLARDEEANAIESSVETRWGE